MDSWLSRHGDPCASAHPGVPHLPSACCGDGSSPLDGLDGEDLFMDGYEDGCGMDWDDHEDYERF